MKTQKFSAKIDIIGVNPYVIPPKEVLQFLFAEAKKDKGAIPVKGLINGKDFTQTVVKYAGEWRLYINTPMIKATGVGVGDTAVFEISFDPIPRIEPMHPEFKIALTKNKKAQETFETYSPSRQKEINRYLNNIKSKEVRQKNIDKIVRHLAGEEVEYFVLLRNKK